MSVELIPNPDIFDEVYRSDSEAESSSSDSEDEASESEQTKIKKKGLANLRRQRDVLQETVSASSAALQLLENFYNRIEDPDIDKVEKGVDLYVLKRKKLYTSRNQAQLEKDVLEDEIACNEKKLRAAQREGEKAKKSKKQKLLRERRRQDRIEREKNATQRRLKNERINFWPKKVYKIVLNLDTGYGTPLSSRRASVNDVSKAALSSEVKELEVSSDPLEVSLCLSYITNAASWIPRYDVNMDTTANSGTIVYRGEFINSTSETWRNAKVILSTSQASFQGLNEPVPTLKPWNIRLQKNSVLKGGKNADSAMLSNQEQVYSQKIFAQQNQVWDLDRRSDLFGLPNQDLPWVSPGSNNPFWQQKGVSLFGQSNSNEGIQQGPPVQKGLFGQPVQQNQNAAPNPFQNVYSDQIGQQSKTSGAFGLASRLPPAGATQVQSGGSLFGGNNAPTGPVPSGGLFGRPSSPRTHLELGPSSPPPPPDFISQPESTLDDSASTYSTSASTLDTQGLLTKSVSTTLTTGLSTTHTLPHPLTLSPSFTPRRHILSTITLPTLTLTRTIIPKLRPAAFLRAKITNPSTSNTPLLRGTAGLTVDGSFLGSVTLPSRAPGDTFSLPMGVDPRVEVEYGEPTVKRAKAGGFLNMGMNKEEKAVYVRSIVVRDRRGGGGNTGLGGEQVGEVEKEGMEPVRFVIRDQVPVSEDAEKVKVEILSPPYLKSQGDAAIREVGEGASSSAETGSRGDGFEKRMGLRKGDREWGKATASLGKRGEVEWDVKLNPGKAVRFNLEYEVRWPGGEGVVCA